LADGIKIEIKGFDGVMAKLKTLKTDTEGKLQSALNTWADDVASDARATLHASRPGIGRATSNTGTLAGSIKSEYGNLWAGVKVQSSYGAYIEFGTRKFAASYVSGLSEPFKKLAQDAKNSSGGGGTFEQMVAAIRQWLKDRGYDEKNAYITALNILKNGIRPQPFLYPAVNARTPELEARIQKLLK
jgi:phage gpG-like protein